MTTASSPFPALPPLPAAVRGFVARLPIRPPSVLLAAALNRVLLPQLPNDAAAQLAGHAVEIAVRDLGVRCRLILRDGRFRSTPDQSPVTLRIAADTASYLRLLRGEDDADRLFFERALVMEGDTEYGLMLKNTLDAIGPLLRWPILRS